MAFLLSSVFLSFLYRVPSLAMSSRGDAGEGPGSDSAPSPGRRSSLRMRAKSLFSSAARSLGKVGAKAKEKMQSTKGSIQRSKLSRVVGGHDGTDAKKIPSITQLSSRVAVLDAGTIEDRVTRHECIETVGQSDAPHTHNVRH